MIKKNITFEQFLTMVDAGNHPFVQELHEYLLENGCKAAFEKDIRGYLASYKYGKRPKPIVSFVFRKEGMLIRIYGEQINAYPDFLTTLPKEMMQHIENSDVCKKLVNGICTPKCNGYDFMIGRKRFQKCRYNCFEFLMSDESKPYIKIFVENELRERNPVAI